VLRHQTAARVTLSIEIAEGGLKPTIAVRINSDVDQLVRAMCFSKEAPITGLVRGTTGFV